jgi:hypothetical protein
MTRSRFALPIFIFLILAALALPGMQQRYITLAQEMTPRYYSIGTPTLKDLWIDPVNGNDSAGGGSRDQALQSVAAAWDRIPSNAGFSDTGYRLMLVSGDYPESLMPSSGWMADRLGTYQFPVVMQSADGPLAAHIHAYLNFFDVKYVYLIGLDFVTDPGYGGGGNVVHIASSDHILIRDCRLNGYDGSVRQPQETFKVNQAQYIYVEDSEFAGAFWFSLDYVAVQYGHIVGSRVHDSGDDGLVLKGGSAYMTVEGNEIYNTGVIGFTAGQGSGFEFMVSPWIHYEAYDLKFVNNIVHDTQNAGMAVRGGYNILMAYNTLYRIGIVGGSGSPMFLANPGARSCDGDSADCQARHDQGGWGSAVDDGEWIPNKNVYVYNNIFYNPAPVQTLWSHFDIRGPVSPPADTNVPSPALSDDNLRIWGNVIWNGPADMPIGIEDADQGCQASNTSCNETQLRADNSFNTIEPQMVSPSSGDFHPAAASNLLSAATFAIPGFAGNDRPSPPVSPSGNLSNDVADDYTGAARVQSGPPGAYSGSGTRGPVLFDISGQVTDSSGAPLAGVSIVLTGSATATASTDQNGSYSFSSLTGGVGYTVTPSLRKYVFSPEQQVVVSLSRNQISDFVGSRRQHKH